MIEMVYYDEDGEDDYYASLDGKYQMRRENGLTPNGTATNGRWVFRKNGEVVDIHYHRYDIFEWHGVKVIAG